MKKEIQYQQDVFSNFFPVAKGVWGMKDIFVNVYMVLNPFDGTWVLIDTGLKTAASKIKKMAAQLFGEGSKPSAILLTHGHFDHVGSLAALCEEWNVPVYAHYLEVPYLTGKASYPPPDPTVGGGLMSTMSFLYPNSPMNIWNRLSVLPEDGVVPGLPEWKYIHTPGHAPGHVSYYRESDDVLIVGDAFVTTKNESAFSVLFQTKKVSGPPKYFTYDWSMSRQSVKALTKLEPAVVATGYGKPMHGTELRRGLHQLSDNFYDEAVPSSGRYVNEPAVADATGFVYIPPATRNPRKRVLQILAVTATLSMAFVLLNRKGKDDNKRKELFLYETF